MCPNYATQKSLRHCVHLADQSILQLIGLTDPLYWTHFNGGRRHLQIHAVSTVTTNKNPPCMVCRLPHSNHAHNVWKRLTTSASSANSVAVGGEERLLLLILPRRACLEATEPTDVEGRFSSLKRTCTHAVCGTVAGNLDSCTFT